MIGEHHYLKVLARWLKILIYRTKDKLVDFLNREDLIFELRSVTALIGCFNVNVNKALFVFKRFNSRVCLARKVGVYVARRAFNVNGLKRSIDSMQSLSSYQWHFSQNWVQIISQFVWKYKNLEKPKQPWERRRELEESTCLTSDYTTKLQSSRQYDTGTKTEM